MQYGYTTSLYKREEIFKELNLLLSFHRRVAEIVQIVEEKCKPYNMSSRSVEVLMIESILYSYDRVGEKSPVEDIIELSNIIKSTQYEIKLKTKKSCWCF